MSELSRRAKRSMVAKKPSKAMDQCEWCGWKLKPSEKRMYAGGAIWHPVCFFKQFPHLKKTGKGKA